MFALPFLVLLGVWALIDESSKPPSIHLPSASMGSSDPPDSAKVGQEKKASEWKRLTRFVTQTMQLTDANEVARRARKIAPEYPGTARLLMKRARNLQQAEDAAKSPKEIYQLSKTREPYPIFNLRWTKF